MACSGVLYGRNYPMQRVQPPCGRVTLVKMLDSSMAVESYEADCLPCFVELPASQLE